jgi:hypothetical protein
MGPKIPLPEAWGSGARARRPTPLPYQDATSDQPVSDGGVVILVRI